MAKKTRSVEYYRLWSGNGSDAGTWDTDFAAIPADTPESEIAAAVKTAVRKIKWREEPPIIVGLYSSAAAMDTAWDETAVGLIKAEAHSDDDVFEVPFNAVLWFQQATAAEIVALADCGWGGDYPADVVAQFMADQITSIAEMFRYLERIHNTPRGCGFECHVDKPSAIAWLKINRPDVATAIHTCISAMEDGGLDAPKTCDECGAEYPDGSAGPSHAKSCSFYPKAEK